MIFALFGRLAHYLHAHVVQLMDITQTNPDKKSQMVFFATWEKSKWLRFILAAANFHWDCWTLLKYLTSSEILTINKGTCVGISRNYPREMANACNNLWPDYKECRRRLVTKIQIQSTLHVWLWMAIIYIDTETKNNFMFIYFLKCIKCHLYHLQQ